MYPRVELDRLVSDINRGLVGTRGGREVGGGRGAFVVEVEADGVDPERVVAIFISLENRLPFAALASVSVEESVDEAANRGRSLREECTSCGSTLFGAGGTGSGAMIGAGGLLGSTTLPVAGTCRGEPGALYSEALRWWAAGIGGRDDWGTGGRGRWRGPGGGTGGGIVSSWRTGSSVCAIF